MDQLSAPRTSMTDRDKAHRAKVAQAAAAFEAALAAMHPQARKHLLAQIERAREAGKKAYRAARGKNGKPKKAKRAQKDKASKEPGKGAIVWHAIVASSMTQGRNDELQGFYA